jgi:hypothetical protein
MRTEKVKEISMPAEEDATAGFHQPVRKNSLDNVLHEKPKETGDTKEDTHFTVPVSHLNESPLEPVPHEQQPAVLPADAPQVKDEVPGKNQYLSAEGNPDRKQCGREDWERYEKELHQKAAVVKLARRGSTSSEISKRLNISQDEVELVIRASRENT